MSAEFRSWIPIIVMILAQVVAVVWSWAKIDKKIAVSDAITAGKFCEQATMVKGKFEAIEEKITNKFDGLAEQVKEIKENHLHDLKDDIKDLGTRIDKHIANSK